MLEDAVQELRWGASLHDIGKLAIPDAVLLKPGRLSAQEWATMQLHVPEGHRLAETLGFLPPEALSVITQHHERWDGSGYLRELRENTYPVERPARWFRSSCVRAGRIGTYSCAMYTWGGFRARCRFSTRRFTNRTS
ncbi:HD-GYP domain-containing protein [Deinococcus koreensis]|uniref:HD-GYP domain-containing protein n=1 Tax=Deinococcus koreensis TaxID=2054903 RepID=UPI002435A2F8|nr:HD domain-containing phosphohydrolase [Deinococcus koreensis]